MRNGPVSAIHSDGGGDRWDVDSSPTLRLWCLFGAFALVLMTISARVLWLQTARADESNWRPPPRTIVVTEPIAAMDGRILSGDGRVLAYDVEQFDVQIHYRWLERPANPSWLRETARARLSPELQRARDAVEQSEQLVISMRRAFWDRLAVEVGVTRAEFADRIDGVQRRVERIRERVRQARASGEELPERSEDVWDSVVAELTTPPQRGVDDPVVIHEELDYHTVVTNVPREVALQLEAEPERFPGVKVVVSTKRHYPQKDLAAHLVGSRRPIDEATLSARQEAYPDGDPLDYQPGDRIGRTGVERSHDHSLRGIRGLRRLVKNARGEIVSSDVVRQPRFGSDVELTIDLPLQRRAEQLLDEAADKHGGCLVAIDVHTGRILTAAVTPRFDPNTLTQKWDDLQRDPRRPLFPRLTRMTIAPGSVFKTVTAVACMESGLVDPGAKVHCQGYLDRPDRHRCYIYRHHGVGHGGVDLSDAICRSCNVYFFTAARELGPRRLGAWAHRLGFGRKTGIDLPGERSGVVPKPGDRDREGRRIWYSGDTLGLAIGQSRLTVTPIQIARMMAVIANGGRLITPTVASSESRSSDDAHEEVGLRPSTIAEIRRGLERVVADRTGTGYKNVRLNGVTIAGKTGTAQVGPGKDDHAWFAGYTPAENPRIAFAIVLEHAGSGGRAAGPVAREFVRAAMGESTEDGTVAQLNR